MMTLDTKTKLVEALLSAVETQFELIGEELQNARSAFEEKDRRNFHGILGSISSTPIRLEDMQNTLKTLISMAKEQTTEKGEKE